MEVAKDEGVMLSQSYVALWASGNYVALLYFISLFSFLDFFSLFWRDTKMVSLKVPNDACMHFLLACKFS